ncbi:hybrid signal transduction histidine kinase M, partial [Tanacetum coccineum]
MKGPSASLTSKPTSPSCLTSTIPYGKVSKDIFHDNKSARAMQLDNDLQTIELGSLSITEYFHKINRITDMLANIDSPVDEKNLIAYAIKSLGDKYETVTQLKLLLEESRLDRKTNRQTAHDSSSSSPSVLLVVNPNNVAIPTPRTTRVCHNFQRGAYNFGDRSKYLHVNPSGSRTGTRSPRVLLASSFGSAVDTFWVPVSVHGVNGMHGSNNPTEGVMSGICSI